MGKITKIGETKGLIETYNFEVKIKNDIAYIDVTKIGGHIYSMIYNKEVSKLLTNRYFDPQFSPQRMIIGDKHRASEKARSFVFSGLSITDDKH